MGCVYFTRHGQTIWNVENKICGATDIALTQLGHEQAIALGQRIKKEELKIDEILYSPLMRAADTAKHISEETGIPCREEPRLTEQNFGKYESTPRDGVVFQEAKKQFVNHFDGGETMLHLAQRIYNLLDEINAEATTVLADYIAQHPEAVLPCLNLVSVFRKLERSGDHITNIAEEIVFFIDAKVLKHSGKTDEHYPLTKK